MCIVSFLITYLFIIYIILSLVKQIACLYETELLPLKKLDIPEQVAGKKSQQATRLCVGQVT